ncbi:hypothetical protein PSN45_002168 [Yamadazyma tenuis]|nr:hypothetical protein PSN45_002168 [Yamadazyma tenuis]
MLSPEYVADLVVKPDFNDLFFTSLSQDSPFSGDKSYKVIPKSPNQSPQSVNLLFGEITTKYIQVYNSQTYKLKQVPENITSSPLNTKVELNIQRALIDYMKSVKLDKISSRDQLYELGSRLKVFENTRKLNQGKIDLSGTNEMVTVEGVCIYLLDKGRDKVSEMAVVEFVKENLSSMTISSTIGVTEAIVKALKVSPSSSKLLDLIVQDIIPNSPESILRLHPSVLNDFVEILASNGFITEASKCLKVVIVKQQMEPSVNALEAYLNAYVSSDVDRLSFVRYNSFLKGVITSLPLTPVIAKIILDKAVGHSYELEAFVKILSTESNVRVLKELSPDIINKYIEIEKDNQDVNQQVKVARLVSLISNLKSKGLELSQIKESVGGFFSQSDYARNIESLS